MTAHHRRTRLRLVGLLTAIAATASLAVVATAGPASADPVITGVSAYAVSVPSSVLAAAGTGADISGVSDGQYGAILANTSKFDSDWITTPVGQEMGGTTTTAPPDITDLSPAELETFDSLTAGFAGAPATAASGLSVAGAAGSVLEFAGAAEAGIALGADADRLLGLDVTGDLCRDTNGSGSAASQIIATLTMSDCQTWATGTSFQTVMNENAGTLTTGGLSCYTNDPSECVQIIGASAAGPEDYCLQATGSDKYVSFIFNYPGEPNPAQTYAMTGQPSQYPCAGAPTGTSEFGYGWYQHPIPVTSYCATYDDAFNCDGAAVATVTVSQNTPILHFTCTTTMSDNTTQTKNSATFYASDATLPVPEMPAVPSGKVPASVVCYIIGGPSPVLALAPTTTTPSYQNWVTNDPECQNGSCLVDLKLNGQSCLFSTASCDGWVTDPTRSDDYKCYVGTHLAPISECYIYGTTFNQGDRSSGHGYANPTNGQITEGETSESDLDELTGDLINRGQEQWGPTGSGLLLGGGGTAAVASEAAAIAAYCLLQLGTVTACLHVRIFSPGLDINQAAQHDLEAILGTGTGPFDSPIPKGPFLTYAATSPVSSGWYNSTPPCSTGTYDTDLLQCDEYPFRSTTTAGPGASLRTIDKVQNGAEGLYLQHFYQACGLNQPNDTGVFFVAPQPTLPTSEWCT